MHFIYLKIQSDFNIHLTIKLKTCQKKIKKSMTTCIIDIEVKGWNFVYKRLRRQDYPFLHVYHIHNNEAIRQINQVWVVQIIWTRNWFYVIISQLENNLIWWRWLSYNNHLWRSTFPYWYYYNIYLTRKTYGWVTRS